MLRRTFLSLFQETSAIYKETFYHVNPLLYVTFKCISISCVLFTLAPTFIRNFAVVFYGENIQWLSDFVPLYANNALIGILPPWLCLNIVGSSQIYGCGITLLRPTGLFCFFFVDSWGVAQSAAGVSVCVGADAHRSDLRRWIAINGSATSVSGWSQTSSNDGAPESSETPVIKIRLTSLYTCAPLRRFPSQIHQNPELISFISPPPTQTLLMGQHTIPHTADWETVARPSLAGYPSSAAVPIVAVKSIAARRAQWDEMKY
jgi:hypothetical protein